MNDSLPPDDAAPAVAPSTPTLLDFLRGGEGVCIGRFALTLGSLVLRTELSVQSSLELKRKPETGA